MATAEHKKLATLIKETHSLLRNESQYYGPQEAWNRHLARTNNLQNYAKSMQELSTAHWKNNLLHSSDNSNCRIQWIKNQCYDYFLKGGKDKYHQREIDIGNKASIKLNIEEHKPPFDNTCSDGKKISLLDVGSCYNPLGDDSVFDVTALDIAPYSDRVLQCDFLNTDIGSKTLLSNNKQSILQLSNNSFDVCVFSLLLEYFPCPEQRFQCCQKAFEVLKDTGILIIITPDSKHVGANAKIMKSWRFVLSKLGFMRIKYEKLKHLHCICFRKCRVKDIAVRWANMQTFSKNDKLFSSDSKMYIPQDFHVSCFQKKQEHIYDANELVTGFDELPGFIVK